MGNSTTDRRSFLKTGSLVAAPLAMVAPVAALAGDDSRAKLARLEDERAIEALQRKFLRHLNGTGDGSGLIASPGSVDLGEGLRTIAEDHSHDAVLELSEDGLTARARCTCRIERETEFTGNSTIEQMTRLQRQGSHRFEAWRTLATELVKGEDGWRIARAQLA